ncbi:MAG: SAM-dependent methyltransferase [Lachnospiraceae bacterium]|nr:SAM-dependent methyltransferase [Lachnospiraceae bacterium]
MELPLSFKNAMKALLGEEYDDLIRSYDDIPYSAIRINTSKISVSDFEKIAPFEIKKIPFVDNGYYINETDKWAKHPYYHAGLYYIQEPSAMYAASLLPVSSEDIVLDLCAAPGGKSTFLATRAPGLLISNDISRSRTMPLVKNLEHFGTGNFAVTCEDPSKLSDIYRDRFDRILVDAPCSGEGMFRRDNKLISSYLQKGPEYYSPIQRDILESAYKMLRPGGSLLYLTCTFSDIEDEQVICSFLDDHHDMKVCPIPQQYGLRGPYDKYRDDPKLSGVVHALPHRFGGEGHFMALMTRDHVDSDRKVIADLKYTVYDRLPDGVKDLAGLFSDSYMEYFINRKFLTAKDGYIYILPDHFEDFYEKGIRYSRTGTCIGNVNGSGRFAVHTALALSIRETDHKNVLSFAADDPAVLKYLKGETLTFGREDAACDLKKGYVLVCVEHFPLGFAKYDGKKLKNLYEKGWIYS